MKVSDLDQLPFQLYCTILILDSWSLVPHSLAKDDPRMQTAEAASAKSRLFMSHESLLHVLWTCPLNPTEDISTLSTSTTPLGFLLACSIPCKLSKVDNIGPKLYIPYFCKILLKYNHFKFFDLLRVAQIHLQHIPWWLPPDGHILQTI